MQYGGVGRHAYIWDAKAVTSGLRKFQSAVVDLYLRTIERRTVIKMGMNINGGWENSGIMTDIVFSFRLKK